MYRRLSQTTDRVVGFRVGGQMSRDDFRLITRQVEDALEEHGSPLCLLVEFEDLESIEPGALWDDVRFSIKHWHDIEAMAVVGDKESLKQWVRVGGAISPTEVRYFAVDRSHEAWEWLRDRDRNLLENTRKGFMEHTPTPIRQILVAVDLTPSCHFVVRTSKLLSEKTGSRLALLHVVDFVPAVEFGFSWAAADITEPGPDELEGPALEQLKKLSKELGVGTAELMARRGDPRIRILEAADELNADLIIIGNKSRRGLGRLLGSTANGVVHAARCNVLTVPVPAPP